MIVAEASAEASLRGQNGYELRFLGGILNYG
jgi:hypothetical protein